MNIGIVIALQIPSCRVLATVMRSPLLVSNTILNFSVHPGFLDKMHAPIEHQEVITVVNTIYGIINDAVAENFARENFIKPICLCITEVFHRIYFHQCSKGCCILYVIINTVEIVDFHQQ